LYVIFISPTHAACPINLIHLYLITMIIFGKVWIMKFLIMSFSPSSCYSSLVHIFSSALGFQTSSIYIIVHIMKLEFNFHWILQKFGRWCFLDDKRSKISILLTMQLQKWFRIKVHKSYLYYWKSYNLLWPAYNYVAYQYTVSSYYKNRVCVFCGLI
jgi:hypothetical protein